MSAPSGQPGATFLDRVAGKAREEDTGVSPRRPSLFEPTHPLRVDAADAESSALTEVDADSGPQPTQNDGVTPVRLDRIVESRSPRMAMPHEMRSLEPAPPDAKARAETSSASPANSAPPYPVAPPRPIEPLFAPVERPAPTAPRSVDHHATAAPALRIADTALARPIGDFTSSRAGTRVERAPATNGALVPSGEPGLRRVLADPPATRRRAAPEPARADRAAADTGPVVNVTIGRVEVRAAPAAPVPRRSEARGPRPLSLEDYLEQRESGRR